MATVNWGQYIAQAEAAGESLEEFTPIPADSYEVSILEHNRRRQWDSV